MKLHKSFEFCGIAGLGFSVAGVLIVAVSAATNAFDPMWCMLALGPAALATFAMLGIFAYEIYLEK